VFVGLIAVKKDSKRFKNKNIHPVNGVPMFWYSVAPLLKSSQVDDVYVLTNSEYVVEYCKDRGVNTIWRPENASRSEDKMVNVLRYGYYNLEKSYDGVITIMANCPGHNVDQVNTAINRMVDQKLDEVRSFNHLGEESGLIIFSKKIMESNQDVSYYMGCTIDEVIEIHYESDLDKL